MNISNRLKAVCDLVAYKSVCDVGTDHGYVPIYLVKENICQHAVAMDINKGPLEKAKENVELFNLKESIDLRLANGLDKFEAGETESLVISGMGGILMNDILHKHPEVTKGFKQLILSPQGDEDLVRREMEQMGFAILREDMVYEDGKYYFIIDFRKCEEEIKADKSDVNYLFGRYLIETKHPILLKYLENENSKYLNILNKLMGNNGEEAIKRKEEIEEYLENVNKAIKDIRGK